MFKVILRSFSGFLILGNLVSSKCLVAKSPQEYLYLEYTGYSWLLSIQINSEVIQCISNFQ